MKTAKEIVLLLEHGDDSHREWLRQHAIPLIESYGKQEYQRGVEDAATIFEFESCIDHEFVHGEAICVAARIRSLAEKK